MIGKQEMTFKQKNVTWEKVQSRIKGLRLIIVSFVCVFSFMVRPALAGDVLVGSDAGSFSVGGAGQASWSMPIEVPSGVNGVSPKLQLSISSLGGNGLLGVGGGLSGVSAISRCSRPVSDSQNAPHFQQVPEFIASDAYCIDGQRLVLVSGTQGADGSIYRTEIESFQRFKAVGSEGNSGPLYFELTNRSGATMIFGQDQNRNTIERDVKTNVINAWKIDRLQDRDGNRLDYSYEKKSGLGSQLTNIAYGANTNSGVSHSLFVDILFEERPDKTSTWTGGQYFTQDKRINEIVTRVADTVARRISINYEQGEVSGVSRIASVQQCAGNGDCYRPTTFTYQAEQNFSWQSNTALSLPDDLQNSDGFPRGQLVDIDNDGMVDWVTAVETDSGSTISTWLKKGGNWQSNAAYQLPGALYDYSNSTKGVSTGLLLDINGDGWPEFVQAYKTAAGTTLRTWENTGNGWSENANLALPVPLVSTENTPDGQSLANLADLNGDGLVDVIQSYTNASGITIKQSWLNTSAGWQLSNDYAAPSAAVSYQYGVDGRAYSTMADLNGDGLVDWVKAHRTGAANYLQTWLNTGQGWQLSTDYALPKALINNDLFALGIPEYTLNDINADGLVDLVKAMELSGSLQTDTWINTGAGWQQDSNANLPAALTLVSTGGVAAQVGGFTDLDGDGQPEFLQNAKLSDGTLLQSAWSIPSNQTFSGTTLPLPAVMLRSDGSSYPYAQLVDLDGDGSAESLTSVQGQAQQIFSSSTAGQYAGALIAIKNSMGLENLIEYGMSTDPNFYTDSPRTPYPNIAQNGPMLLVKEAKVTGPTGGYLSARHEYGGGKINLTGQGGLGLAFHTVIDDATNAEQTMQYFQEYPFAGKVKSSEKKVNGVLLSATTKNYASKTINLPGDLTTTVYPYATGSVNTIYSYDTPGLLVRQSTTEHTIDDYGNVTYAKETVADANGVHLISEKSATYENNNNNSWILGLPQQSNVTLTNPITGEVSTNSSKAYFTAEGKLYKEELEPDNALALTKTYAYNTFGLRTESTTTGVFDPNAGSVESRTVTTQYSTDGRFPERVTNPLGHSATSTYDAVISKPLTVTDANGLVKEYLYDGFGGQLREAKAHESTGSTYRKEVTFPRFCDDPNYNQNCPAEAIYFIAGFDDDGEAPEVAYYNIYSKEVRRQTFGHDRKVIAVDTSYDAFGRKKTVSQPYFLNETPRVTSFFYDAIDRQVRRLNANNDEFKTIFSGTTITTVNPGNGSGEQRTVVEQNVFGKPVKTTDPAGFVTEFSYDVRGNLVQTKDAKGNIATIDYDLFGRKVAMDDPDLGAWSYQYNAFGELIQQTDAKGQSVTMSYDKIGRLLQRSEPEGQTEWTYDGTAEHNKLGALAKVTSPLYSREVKYDILGRPEQADTNIDGVDFTQRSGYTGAGDKLDWMQYPSGVTTRYTYDSYGYPKTVEGIDLDHASYQQYQEASAALHNLQRELEKWEAANLLPDDLELLGYHQRQLAEKGAIVAQFYNDIEDAPALLAINDQADAWTALIDQVNLKVTQHQNWLNIYTTEFNSLYEPHKADFQDYSRYSELAEIEQDQIDPEDVKKYEYWSNHANSYNASINEYIGKTADSENIIRGTISNMFGEHAPHFLEDYNRIYADYAPNYYAPGNSSQDIEGGYTTIGFHFQRIDDCQELIEGWQQDQQDDIARAQSYYNRFKDHAEEIERLGGLMQAIYTRIGAPAERIEKWLNPIIKSHNNILLAYNDRLRLYSDKVSEKTGGYAKRSDLASEVFFKQLFSHLNYIECLQQNSVNCYRDHLVEDAADQADTPADATVDVKQLWANNRFYCPHYYGYSCPTVYTDEIRSVVKTIDCLQNSAQSHCTAAVDPESAGYKNRAKILDVTAFKQALQQQHQTQVETLVRTASNGTEDKTYLEITQQDQTEPELVDGEAGEEAEEKVRSRDYVLIAQGEAQVYSHEQKPEDIVAMELSLQEHKDAIEAIYVGYEYYSYVKAIEEQEQRVQDLYDDIDQSNAKKVYWEAKEINANGQIVRAHYGNDTESTWGYDQFGRINDVLVKKQNAVAGTEGSLAIVNAEFSYDAIGNLIYRKDLAVDLEEHFDYDIMNRLTSATIQGDAAGLYELVGVQTTTYDYDELGNIKRKSDFGTGEYHYGANGAGPHAVTSVDGVAGGFTYDANGNRLTGNGSTVQYSSFNKPVQIINNGTTDMLYGAERQLMLKKEDGPEGISTTRYVGGYELIQKQGVTLQRHNISIAGTTIAVVEREVNAEGVAITGTEKESYLHKDHQGSVIAITDANGDLLERRHYDAFGDVRRAIGESLQALVTFGETTDKGYTGHKHLTQSGLIHMGGRVFDPQVGRFTSADPHIQSPLNSQSLNRYAYVLNNPLSLVDPSGYFSLNPFKNLKKLFKKLREYHRKVKKWVKKYIKVIVVVVITVVIAIYAPALLKAWGQAAWALTATGGLTIMGAAAVGAITGAISGLIMTGSIKGALQGAAFGALTGGVAKYLTAGTNLAGAALKATQIAVHGAIGGLRSVVNGGKFLAGFVTGAISKAITIGSDWLSSVNDSASTVVKGLIVATAGGLASQLAGGSFAQGFLTAGLAFSLNNLFEDRSLPPKGEVIKNEPKSNIEARMREREILRKAHWEGKKDALRLNKGMLGAGLALSQDLGIIDLGSFVPDGFDQYIPAINQLSGALEVSAASTLWTFAGEMALGAVGFLSFSSMLAIGTSAAAGYTLGSGLNRVFKGAPQLYLTDAMCYVRRRC